MTDVWVCGACKSINRQRNDRCYSCGARREAAMPQEGPDVRVEAAVANRAMRGYVPSWPFAAAAGVLILAVAAIGVYLVVAQLDSVEGLRAAFTEAIQTDNPAALDPILAEQQQLASPSLLRLGLLLLAVLAFGLWLSRVCLNIPVLGGGTPGWGPAKAFLYPLIPIVNIIKVPGMIQDALYRLDRRAGGFFMVLLAWIGFAGSWFVGVVGSFAIAAGFVGEILRAATREAATAAFGRLLDQTVILSLITELMTAAGAVLLVLIIARIESRAAARDHEIREALTGGPAPA